MANRGHGGSWGALLVAVIALAGCASNTTGSTAGTGPATLDRSGTSRPVEAGSGTTASGPDRPSPRRVNASKPSVSGPITGGQQGKPFNAMPRALADKYGYVEEEYFISGEATSYSASGTPASDGAWSVTPEAKAPYTTRIVVRRPADKARFDGTALVEWLNVSSGQDSDVEFALSHDELLSHGTAWVGVSAQPVGINGGTTMAMPGLDPSPLKKFDPERYAPLTHPGDDFSYDIFSQAGALLRQPDAVGFGGARVRAVMAAGESQSAARMVTYVDAIHPVADVYDGFLIHSRSHGGAAIKVGAAALPQPARIRADLTVPVFQFETETDLFGLPFIEARQPDTDLLRTWEVAGTAHLDRYLVDYLRSQGSAGGVPPRSGEPGESAKAVIAQCGSINEGPQFAVLSKAVASLRAWVVDGTKPASGPPIEVANGAIARDERGNALGGIRTPPVDAPLSTLRGDNPGAAGYACSLFGSTTKFDEATRATLYPEPSAYVDAVRRSAGQSVQAGHLREVDANIFIDEANRSSANG